MARMHSLDIWPLHLGANSVQELLERLSELELPVLEAAPDEPYTRPVPVPHQRWGRANSADSWNGPSPARSVNGAGGWGNNPSPSVTSISDAPNHVTMRQAVECLKDLCVGICLDCIKGNEVCRVPHPRPWKKRWLAMHPEYGWGMGDHLTEPSAPGNWESAW